MSSVETILSNISVQINELIRNPNHGGCAVIAAVIGSELSNHTNVEVLVQDSSWSSDGQNINMIKSNVDTSNFKKSSDWHEHGLYFSHVLLKVMIGGKWMVYDSDGLIEYNSKDYCEGSLTIKEVEAIAVPDSGWNHMFNRAQIPSIINLVCKAFSISSLTNMRDVKFEL